MNPDDLFDYEDDEEPYVPPAGTALPADLDAEESLIGAMLLDQGARETGLVLLSASDFYKPAHGTIFNALDDLHHSGADIDAVTVAHSLEASGQLVSIGGPATLISLQSRTPAISSHPTYCRIILDAAQRRSIIGYAKDLSDLAHDGLVPGEELAPAARERLDAIVRETTSSLPDGLSTLTEFMDRPEEERAPWAIPGLLRTDWRVMIVGGEGAGKSVLLRQLAISSSAGLHPLTHRPIPAVTTLVVDYENPDQAIEDVCGPMHEVACNVDGWDPDRAWLWRQQAGVDLRSRHDRVQLESVIRACQPNVVVMGPVYKMYQAGEGKEEAAVSEVQHVLDDLRKRYGFGLVLEHHAPHGENDRKRAMRPHGSVLWRRWPELGLAMLPIKDRDGSFTIGRFRGDRLGNQWPTRLDRSGRAWPWDAAWPDGTFAFDNPDEEIEMF